MTTMKIPCRATSLALKGDRLILEYTTSGAASTSPPKGVLRHMLHQSIGEQPGRTTGRLRSTGLEAMPS